MENRINIAELLKDCPTGMELDCLIYDNLYFSCIREHPIYPIICWTVDSKGITYNILFDRYGKSSSVDTAKCVIFPKGRNTWKGFNPYYQFKNGDVVATKNGAWIGITTGGDSRDLVPTHCVIKGDGTFAAYLDVKTTWCFSRFATEEEKQKLFNAIKENGYHWNTETKTLEKLAKPEFNVGDWIIRNNKYTGVPVKVIEFDGCYSCELNGEVVNLTRNDVHNNFHLWTIDDAKDGDVLFHSDSASNGIFIFKKISQRGTLQKVICYCDYDSEDGFCLGENHTCCYTDSKILCPATKEQCDLLFSKMKKMGYKWNEETKTLEKLFEPKFKVGDKVRHKITNEDVVYEISKVYDDSYGLVGFTCMLYMKYQDQYELVPNKFDIITLVPFESRVLVRDNGGDVWRPAIFGCQFKNREYPFFTMSGCYYKQCIPYDKNKELVGTTIDCDEYYKTWEEEL